MSNLDAEFDNHCEKLKRYDFKFDNHHEKLKWY